MKGYLKSASSVKTGKKFYESRLAKNYSIDDVAEILYINKDYVRAIESGNFSIFPSKIFAKAYFDKYRKFLGINCQLPDVFDDIESKELKNLKKEVRLPYDWNKKIKKFSAIIASLFLLALLFYFIPNSVSISEQDTTIQEINPERLKPLEESVFNNNIIQNNSFKKDNENVNLKQEVLDIAAKYPMLGIKLLVIDTERKFIASGFGKELAEAAQGKYVQLPKATDKAIAAMALNAINEF